MENQIRTSYKPKDSFLIYILALCVPIVVSLLVSLVINMITGGIAEESDKILNMPIVQVVYTLIYAGALIALFLLYPKKQKIDFKKATGVFNKTHYLNIAICICLGACFVYLCSPIVEIYTYLISLIGVVTPTSLAIPMDNFGWLLLALFLSGVVPAVVEELIYRGMILNGLRKYGMWPSVLISAGLFALMHLTLYQLPYTFALGIVLGLVVYKTRALWLSMLIHFSSNALVLVSMYLQNGQEIVPANLDVWYVVMAIVMAIFAAVLVFGAIILIDKLVKKQAPENITYTQPTEAENKEEKHLSKAEKVDLEIKLEQEKLEKQIENKQTKKYLIIGIAFAVIMLIINTAVGIN